MVCRLARFWGQRLRKGNDIFRYLPVEPVVIEVIRFREGQLSFSDKAENYSSGETIELDLEETLLREKALVLWVAIMASDGHLIYITETGFTDIPSVFKALVPVSQT